MPTMPPPDAIRPARSPIAPSPGAEIPTHYRWCYGCGVDHPAGLHMVVTAGENLTVHGVFKVGELHQGAPGLAHGGLLSAALDEVLGSLNWLLGVPAVTGRLECDFRSPVPVGTTLYINAEIVAVEGRKVYTQAIAYMNQVDGPIAVNATALFVQVDISHFVNNGNAREVQAAIDDRESSWRKMADTPEGANTEFEVNP